MNQIYFNKFLKKLKITCFQKAQWMNEWTPYLRTLLVQMDLPYSNSLSFTSKTQTWLLQAEILYSLSLPHGNNCPNFLPQRLAPRALFPAPLFQLCSTLHPPLTAHISSRDLSAHPTPRALLRLSAQSRISFTTCPCDPSLQPVITPSPRSHQISLPPGSAPVSPLLLRMSFHNRGLEVGEALHWFPPFSLSPLFFTYTLP